MSAGSACSQRPGRNAEFSLAARSQGSGARTRIRKSGSEAPQARKFARAAVRLSYQGHPAFVGSAFFDGRVFGWVLGADVVGAGADQAVVVVLFDDVCGPAGDAAHGKDRSEEIDVDAERGVGGC